MRWVVKCAFAHDGVCLSWGWPCAVDRMLKSRYWLTNHPCEKENNHPLKQACALVSTSVSPLQCEGLSCIASWKLGRDSGWPAVTTGWITSQTYCLNFNQCLPAPHPHTPPPPAPPSGYDWWKDWVNVNDSPDLNYEITFWCFICL